MLLSVQTAFVVQDFGNEAGYKLLRDCGFEAIDWNIDLYWDRDAVEAGKFSGCSIYEESPEAVLAHFADELAEIRKNGLVVTQAHAPFSGYVGSSPEMLAYCIKIYKSCIRLCAEAGCKNLIIHGVSCRYDVPHIDAEAAWKANLELYSALIPDLLETGVTACMENLFASGKPTITEGTCHNPQEAVALIDTLNEMAGAECFGLCLDTGHLNLMHKHIPTYIRTLGKRIKALHIHDNDAVSDQHLMPFVGCFRWKEFIDALKEIGYDGDLSFETFCQYRSDRMEKDYVPVFLRAIASIGEIFRRKLQQ